MKISKAQNRRFQVGMALLLAAGITGGTLVLCFILRDVAPFGSQSLCSMDGYSQYYPMLREMRRAVRQGNLFWSWNGALGFPLWAQSAYYTNSPLWLLLYLLPEDRMLSGIDLLVLLRLVLCSVTFCLYLLWKFPAATEHTVLLGFPALSLAWALNGWNLAFINQFMWLDVIVLLPLVICALERLLQGKSVVLYVLTLALALWSCFYTGWMLCLFLALYVAAQLLKCGVRRDLLRTAGRFAGASVCAACLASPVLLPVFHALKHTMSASLCFQPPLAFSYAPTDIPERLVPFQQISLVFESPNLFCTLTAVFLAAVYFLQSRQPAKQKWIELGFTLALLVSMLVNLGDYVWHGLHYPNQLPCRESFLFIFVLLTHAAKGLQSVRWKQQAVTAIAVCMLAEACGNFVWGFSSQTWISSNDSLLDHASQMTALAGMQTDDGLERAAWVGTERNNMPMQYGYRGVGYYSSTMSADAYRFFRALGMPRYAENVSTLYSGGDLLNAVFAVRYTYDALSNQIRENPNAFPTVFATSDSVLPFNPEHFADAGAAQQTLLHLLTDGEGFDALPRLKRNALQVQKVRPHHICGVIQTRESFVFTSIPFDDGWSVFVDGHKVDCVKTASYFCGFYVQPGTHDIELRFFPVGLRTGLCLACLGLLALLYYYIKGRNRPPCVPPRVNILSVCRE